MKLAHYRYFLLICGVIGTGLCDAASSSSDLGSPVPSGSRSVRSLKEQALAVLLKNPAKTAEIYDTLYDPNCSLNPREAELFLESVNGALIKRLGFEAFDVKFDIPIKSTVLSRPRGERFEAFSPDGNFFVTAWYGYPGYGFGLHNASTGQLIARFEQETFKGFSPSGKFLISEVLNKITVQTDMHLRDAATGALLRVFSGERDLTFSPDGNILASKITKPDFAPANLRLRNAKTDQLIKTIEEEDFKGFSPDGSILATQSPYDPVNAPVLYLRNAKTGELIASFEGEAFSGFSSDGTILISEITTVEGVFEISMRLRNATTGERMLTLRDEKFEGFSNNNILASEKEVLIGEDSRRDLVLRRPQTSASIEGERFKGFSPDGNILASLNQGSMQVMLNLRNTETGEFIKKDLPEQFDAFSPDSKIVASNVRVPADNRLKLLLRNTATGELIRSIMDSGFKGFGSKDAIIATTNGTEILLHQPDFRTGLTKIVDPSQRVFLLKAAQDWLQGKPYTVEAHNAAYKGIINRIPYLNNPLLFDVVTTPTSVYVNTREELDAYAKSVRNPLRDKELKDLLLRTYDAWYDLQKSQDVQTFDTDIFDAFMRTLQARGPAWHVLLRHAQELTATYQEGRAERDALKPLPVVTAQPSSDGSVIVGSSSGHNEQVRAPDAPRTMRLFDDVAPGQP